MTDHERPTDGDDSTRVPELRRRIIATLDHAGASIVETHAAALHLILETLNAVLREAAAVGELEVVQAWCEEQVTALTFYVAAWRPGASPAEAAQEALTGRTSVHRTH